MTKKEKNRQKLIEFLGNPQNEFVNRFAMATEVLGYKRPQTLWRFFSPQELCDIEAEALAIRRSKYATYLARGDKAVLDKMIDGDIQAARLVYQRFEDWAPRKRIEADVSGEVGLKIEYVNDWRPQSEKDGDD